MKRARQKSLEEWGPYLSERQWGTVREDYSRGGDAWNYFTHDQARSRAYRWGEDGIAGLSDDKQQLCFALALWNGKDPILKERLFGLTNSEGNHGEDVKEYYFYLDSTPTHSYMKFLYKYPQAAFPITIWWRRTGDASRARWSTSSSTPASSTATATSTFSWSTPKTARKTSWCKSPRQPGSGGGRAAPAAHPVVPQRLGGVDCQTRPQETEPQTDSGTGGHECGCGGASGILGEYPCIAKARCRCSLPRTKPTTSGFFGHAQPNPVRQRRHQQLRGAGPAGSSESREDRNQGGRPLPVHRSAPARSATCSAAPHHPGRSRKARNTPPTPSARSLTKPWPPGCRRQTSSTSP